MLVKIGTWEIEAIATNNPANEGQIILNFNKYLKDVFVESVEHGNILYGGNPLKSVASDGKTFILLTF